MNYDELYHYGIKGQKWGIRRYQNPDGTLTEEGKKRYGTAENLNEKRKRSTIKKTVAIAIGTATVAAAAVYVAKHPEVVGKVSEKIANAKVAVKDLPKATIAKGKQFAEKKSRLDIERKEVASILKARRHDAKILPKMSEADLKNLKKRLDLEREVGTLLTSEVSAGKKYLSDALVKSGTAVLSAAAAGGVAYAGKKVTEKKLDKEAAGYMFPNPNRKKK